ncbi:hypothetical protein VPNG_05419 [Cytospora leucostoma]|uniref:Major facilitator superfamily (MFS) profile domain-containing protein n=1 Tax=Cytospora leucostoma TaxID=1230097 RepID=A0A423XBJ2_9PEZI|nr:hypothetical protein VPNG_05419 [Cytospora leucostoma]
MVPTGVDHFKRLLLGQRKTSARRAPRFLAFRSSSTFILTTVCIAIFTDICLYGIIVPVIPFALTSRAGISEDSVQTWNAILLACYTIAMFIGSPVVGIYADHTSSRRRPLLIGLFALAGSTILLCLGRTIALLILGRILQGASAAVVWTVGLALVADTVPDNIGQAMGYSGLAMSLGLLVSPAIGGAVFAGAGYYAVYHVAFGCIFLDIILRLILVEKKVARQWIDGEEESDPEPGAADATPANRPPADEGDVSGTTLSDKGVGDMVQHSRAHTTSHAVPPMASSVIESRQTAKYPKLRLLKSRRILAANFGIIIQAGVMASWDTVLPLFVKSTFHWSSTAAGLIFFCIFIPSFTSPMVGWLSDRYGARWPSFAGFVASIPFLGCLRFVTEDTIGHKVLLGALLALMGLTLTFSNMPLMAEITYAIEAEDAKNPGIFGHKGVYGLAYGLFCTAFALGGSIGSLMSGYIMAGAGWNTLTWALAIWMAGGAVVVASGVGGKPASGNKNLRKHEEASAVSQAQKQAVSGDMGRTEMSMA